MNEDDELVDLESTEWWKQNRYRILAGARLKVGLTQEQLAERTGFSLEFIKDCEAGKETICKDVADIFAKALNTYPEKFIMAKSPMIDIEQVLGSNDNVKKSKGAELDDCTQNQYQVQIIGKDIFQCAFFERTSSPQTAMQWIADILSEYILSVDKMYYTIRIRMPYAVGNAWYTEYGNNSAMHFWQVESIPETSMPFSYFANDEYHSDEYVDLVMGLTLKTKVFEAIYTDLNSVLLQGKPCIPNPDYDGAAPGFTLLPLFAQIVNYCAECSENIPATPWLINGTISLDEVLVGIDAKPPETAMFGRCYDAPTKYATYLLVKLINDRVLCHSKPSLFNNDSCVISSRLHANSFDVLTGKRTVSYSTKIE